METCNIKETAALLKCCINTVKNLVRKGRLQGGKVGRKWIFLKEDIYKAIRESQNGTACQRHERNTTWQQSTNEAAFTGYASQLQTERRLDKVLERKTVIRHNSSLIN